MTRDDSPELNEQKIQETCFRKKTKTDKTMMYTEVSVTELIMTTNTAS